MPDEWSISDGYFDVAGTWHETPEETRAALRTAMGDPQPGPPVWFVPVGTTAPLWNPCRIVLEDGHELDPVATLPADLPIGYHDLFPVDGGPTTRLIVHPTSCPEIPSAWGVAVQIYALWSDHSWGIGDLRDLAMLARSVHTAGGSAVLVSPLHQPAPSWPQADSPYYPSSRRAWNPLLLAMQQERPADLPCDPRALIDRDAVWAAKRTALAALYERSSTEIAHGDKSGAPWTVALWNALCDEFGAEWRDWPEPWRRFDRAALVARVESDAEFADRARFHQWCQGLVADQLADVTATGIDIIGDLAVGFGPGGADAWEYQELLALDMRIGAPPDPFSLDGQEWGIPPFIPWRVRAARFQPFIDTIRASLRGVQGLRIDHVMGLFRQFWVPAGGKPSDGAYVEFPADELLAIICLEATRAGTYVVGEDLGTVEPRVRERLADCNIAGTRVFWFEDDPPSMWPVSCLATVTTHDLPTIAGVLSGADGDDEQRDRLAEIALAVSPAAVITLLHEALLAAPSRLRVLAADDLCAATERPNRPGTVDGPNWRRRLPFPVDKIPMPSQ